MSAYILTSYLGNIRSAITNSGDKVASAIDRHTRAVERLAESPTINIIINSESNPEEIAAKVQRAIQERESE